jgi:hypothetical protein
MTTRLRSTLAAAAAVLAAGCAFMNPAATVPAGSSIDAATRALGRPTGEYALPAGGKRLEFARGPFGKHTWMLDFDAGGALRSTTQVLHETHFNAVRAGMERDELLRTIGHPSETATIGLRRLLVWSYRYETPFCQWFQVGLDAGGRVTESSYGPDPMCQDNTIDLASK